MRILLLFPDYSIAPAEKYSAYLDIELRTIFT